MYNRQVLFYVGKTLSCEVLLNISAPYKIFIFSLFLSSLQNS